MGTPMIRTGEQYRDSIRDGRKVWINDERVKDATAHPMFRPLVDFRARIYDMQHEPRFADALSYCSETGEVCAIAIKLPRTKADWGANARRSRRC
jgi:4-hydroxyphenylacetate 3-monooxygenase